MAIATHVINEARPSMALWMVVLTLLADVPRVIGAAPAPNAGVGLVQQGSARASFEVASIRANRTGDDAVFVNVMPGGRFIATNATVRELIQAAYQFEFETFDIVGG